MAGRGLGFLGPVLGEDGMEIPKLSLRVPVMGLFSKHHLFLRANFIKAALAQGEIPKKINAIPISMLISEEKSLPALLMPTENMTTGILNKSTIIPPIVSIPPRQV